MDTTEWVAAFPPRRPLADLLPVDMALGTLTTVDGEQLNYWRTGGEKPVVVVLHGLSTAGLQWLRVAKALAADYDVIMPEFRSQASSAEVWVRDMVQLIETLQLNRPHLVGYGRGIEVAECLAGAYPELVRMVPVGGALQRTVAESLK